MSDTAMTRLRSKFVPAAVRASVYEVIGAYLGAGLEAVEALRELRKAATTRNDPGLAETVGDVIGRLGGKDEPGEDAGPVDDDKLGEHLIVVFDNASPAEIALLRAADVAVVHRAVLLGKAAVLARIQK
jgi:hypothetical protein